MCYEYKHKLLTLFVVQVVNTVYYAIHNLPFWNGR